jgi:GT2 family glycosyltransferase
MVAPHVSVIVPSLNGAHLLPACLDSLKQQTYPSVEVIVADGASTDRTPDLLRDRYAGVKLLNLRRNYGFAGNVNAGLRAARGDFLLLLNNDARAEPDWVEACVNTFDAHPEIGSVASKVLYSDARTLNSAGDVFCLDGVARQRGNGQLDGAAWNCAEPVFGAMGGAAAYRRSMLADVGLFDERFFMYLEDVDLAFRAQLRGWSCVYAPRARAYHEGSASGGGKLASFYNGRNSIRVLAKDVPGRLLKRMLPAVARFQVQRALEALRAWRGSAARATLRGQLVGFAEMPRHLMDRVPIQRHRLVSDEHIYSLFSPVTT